ncbi:hypothetical protein UFOVP410_82 [uncultured Caudovirales phage]|uniref:Uncharacterized protein n=1 Tax=uncultured Caudovirales phage TaxID=2100421 RepID=A0A6J5M773_9CAUD|nr:hypothetical protein UFOVP410_82 [uncultured Caudovirales phage]
MKKKPHNCICHECDIEFTIKITGKIGQKLVPEICPFCGDSLDVREERPLLKDFDDYDSFDEDEYYDEPDEIEDD